MDNALIQLVARLKIHMRRGQNFSVNTQRFFAEPAYAAQVLDQAEESEELELVSTAMDIRNKLGWLKTLPPINPSASNPKVTSTTVTAKPVSEAHPVQRYAFGARS